MHKIIYIIAFLVFIVPLSGIILNKQNEVQEAAIEKAKWNDAMDVVPMKVRIVLNNNAGYYVINDTLYLKTDYCNTCGKIEKGDTLYYPRSFIRNFKRNK
jgi:hypothetical protein